MKYTDFAEMPAGTALVYCATDERGHSHDLKASFVIRGTKRICVRFVAGGTTAYVEAKNLRREPDGGADMVAELKKTRGFGDGWMTKTASDYVRFAIFAGFDPRDIVREIYRIHPSTERLVSIPTVERALGAIEARDKDSK